MTICDDVKKSELLYIPIHRITKLIKKIEKVIYIPAVPLLVAIT